MTTVARIKDPNKIVLGKKNSYNQVEFLSKNPFFKAGEYYIFKCFLDRIEVTRPTLDYCGPMLKASHSPTGGSGWIKFAPKMEYDYIAGDYLPDEDESNEDKLVFNF